MTDALRVGAEPSAAAARVVVAACEYIDAWLDDEASFLPPSYAPLHPLFDAVLAYRTEAIAKAEGRSALSPEKP